MIYIVGAGPMAREAYHYYVDLGKKNEVAGFLDRDTHGKVASIEGVAVNDEYLLATLDKSSKLIVAICSPFKKKVVEKINRLGFGFDTLVHPSVSIRPSVKIGEGSVLCPGAVLTADITVGKHVVINIGSTFNHDCVVGDYTAISPGVTIGGNVKIGEGSWIGLGAKIINNVTIGRGVFIGAGAVVTDNIPDFCLAYGVPAKKARDLKEEDWSKLIWNA